MGLRNVFKNVTLGKSKAKAKMKKMLLHQIYKFLHAIRSSRVMRLEEIVQWLGHLTYTVLTQVWFLSSHMVSKTLLAMIPEHEGRNNPLSMLGVAQKKKKYSQEPICITLSLWTINNMGWYNLKVQEK